MTLVILDSEAVSALLTPASRKGAEVTAALKALAMRRRRGLGGRVVVPTSVRVEARWNRSDPRAAAINRLPIHATPSDPDDITRAAAPANARVIRL